MTRRKMKLVLAALFSVSGTLVLIGLYLTQLHVSIVDLQNTKIFNMETTAKKRPGKAFLVDTPGCKIPDIDPWDESIQSIVSKGSPIECSDTPSLTYLSKGVLKLDRWILKKYYKPYLKYFRNCLYQEIVRKGSESDGDWAYSGPVNFTHSITVKAEFIRVKCFDTDNEAFYINFHTTILRKDGVEKRCKSAYSRKRKEEHLNVVMIGVDSVSRLNFMRQMPRTRNYLLNTLHGYEMSGYNKVADNTFVNICPMFAGKFAEELPWNETLSSRPFDRYNFAWKDFARSGYRTLFAEDAPMISIFNYVKSGFFKQPTDYYIRPYSLAMEREDDVWNANHHCVRDKLETDHVLGWIEDYTDEFRKDPHFAFAFITRLTHDGLNSVGAADAPHLAFLNRLRAKGSLNNTALIYFSDHGFRHGEIRSTYVGKLEERLPFMVLVFPRWFRDKYPDISANLRENAHKLTTPFDVHATLMDIVDFSKKRGASAGKRGQSLLRKIPEDRTCKQAGILPHWCTCQKQERISKDDQRVILAAKSVIETINADTAPHRSLCSKLELHEVHDAYKIAADEKVLTFRQSLNDVIDRKVFYGDRAKYSVEEYLVTLRALPSKALFEATVKYTEAGTTFTVLGDISRINLYGDQSKCIDNYRLKKFCFCS